VRRAKGGAQLREPLPRCCLLSYQSYIMRELSEVTGATSDILQAHGVEMKWKRQFMGAETLVALFMRK
jgi:hypothetical protein